jgi:hypothetical protein
VDRALNRSRVRWEEAPPSPDASTEGGPRAASRSWLRELAIAGWRGVDHDLASGGMRAIAGALDDAGLRPLGVLLDGLAAELRASAPVAAMEQVPARRWSDLWARAVLLSQDGAAVRSGGEVVSGRLPAYDISPRTATTWLYGLIPSSHSAIEAQFASPPDRCRSPRPRGRSRWRGQA